MTLIPRVNGLTFFDIDIQWSHSGTCDNYYVAIITDADYQISFWASTHRKRPPTMWREAGSTITSPISG